MGTATWRPRSTLLCCMFVLERCAVQGATVGSSVCPSDFVRMLSTFTLQWLWQRVGCAFSGVVQRRRSRRLVYLAGERASSPASRMTARSIIHMHFWRQVLHPSQCGIVREQLHSRGHDSRSPPLPSRESVLQRPNCASATLVPGTPGERRRCVLSSRRVCTFPFRCAVLPNWEFRCAFLPFFFRPLLRFDVK